MSAMAKPDPHLVSALAELDDDTAAATVDAATARRRQRPTRPRTVAEAMAQRAATRNPQGGGPDAA